MVCPPLRTKVGKPFTVSDIPPLPPVAAVATCRLLRVLWLRPPTSAREHRSDYNVRDALRRRLPLRRGSVGEGLHGLRSTRSSHRCDLEEKEQCLSVSTPESRTLTFFLPLKKKGSDLGKFEVNSKIFFNYQGVRMRVTRASTDGMRLRKLSPSLSWFSRSSAGQTHSSAAFPVATVEDSHVATQEDITEDPEGP